MRRRLRIESATRYVHLFPAVGVCACVCMWGGGGGAETLLIVSFMIDRTRTDTCFHTPRLERARLITMKMIFIGIFKIPYTNFIISLGILTAFCRQAPRGPHMIASPGSFGLMISLSVSGKPHPMANLSFLTKSSSSPPASKMAFVSFLNIALIS